MGIEDGSQWLYLGNNTLLKKNSGPKGPDLVDNHLIRNADNFWHMWLKVEAQKNNVR
jgi:hypothetical protein